MSITLFLHQPMHDLVVAVVGRDSSEIGCLQSELRPFATIAEPQTAPIARTAMAFGVNGEV
jgi:hypothetical protein